METQVKIIECEDSDALEVELNDFLCENVDIKLIDIKYSSFLNKSGEDRYSALVIYKF